MPSGDFGLGLDYFGDEGDSLLSITATRFASLACLEFNFGFVLSKIEYHETSFSIQSLEKIPPNRCSIVSHQNDSFHDA